MTSNFLVKSLKIETIFNIEVCRAGVPNFVSRSSLPETVRNVKVLEDREGSIITIPPITITIAHPCNQFSITIILTCNRHDYDYHFIASPKLKNDFVTAFTKSELISVAQWFGASFLRRP